MTSEFEKCFTFIDRALDQGDGVLVHCHAGLSRSATIVVMYLMRKYSLTRDEALQRLQSKRLRSDIRINDGFLHQLELFHQMNFRVDPQNERLIDFQRDRLKLLGRKSTAKKRKFSSGSTNSFESIDVDFANDNSSPTATFNVTKTDRIRSVINERESGRFFSIGSRRFFISRSARCVVRRAAKCWENIRFKVFAVRALNGFNLHSSSNVERSNKRTNFYLFTLLVNQRSTKMICFSSSDAIEKECNSSCRFSLADVDC